MLLLHPSNPSKWKSLLQATDANQQPGQLTPGGGDKLQAQIWTQEAATSSAQLRCRDLQLSPQQELQAPMSAKGWQMWLLKVDGLLRAGRGGTWC